jgi:phenylacetate-coenzyme A ligase PaaK-like adenylate-forming protein
MQDRLIRIYHLLPPSARSVAASLRGGYLRAWRYGPETNRLVTEARERELWSLSRWKAWQQQQLAYLLHRAATRVPYYREHWRQRRLAGDRASSAILENWPILDKEQLRTNSRAFVADDCNVRSMFSEHTSGTTGKSLQLWWSRETVRKWYALFEARWRQWYGVSARDRWAILGGQLVAPVRQRKPPFWVWNSALHQLYMSSYHLAPDLIPSYIEALQRYKIRYILGYTSALYSLAQEVLRQSLRSVRLTVVVTNAEPLFDHQRQAIADAFNCPVRETYGMSEIVTAAGQCEHDTLHQWPEVGITELLSDDGAIKQTGTGNLVCTGLLNMDMPLIRYRVGDRATIPATSRQCKCGRALPVISSIEGRADDVLVTADGRRIGRLDPVFKGQLPFREAQIIQEALDRVLVRYVKAPNCTADAAQSIITRVRDYVGPVKVLVEEVDFIPRGANGKFRSVICNVPPQEVAKLRATK